ncbi:hypothetical protein K2173_021827 [Erythroxylum novogranatense]|uniref:Two-component response regulator-like APRR5 n=1 Tax=Erythroxylum novogranatense TaxID=1862640 RepID=A0AAV8T336_9ROSI|nr:hypothetical protein K2173_021827 [Erythroxylum novogranatense]
MGEAVLEAVRRSENEMSEEREREGEEEYTETETGESNMNTKKKKEGDGSNDCELSRWENLFPKMVLRVLLVEADDSTRQIIAALLRKCSYTVTAVPDGLKAWEILRGRPHNIDIILSEIDLPLISGYALLTLIMEHEICKNVPVIMMSSQDSISTVYKCMLRGAADYLVKPIRRNELRNLWQHLWRRQYSLAAGSCPQDESVGQGKLEDSYENNASTNNSIGDMACIKTSRGCIEKGNDAQSSCTKPDLEAENAHTKYVQDNMQPLWVKFLLNDTKMQKHKVKINFGKQLLMHESEAGGSSDAARTKFNKMNVDGNIGSESQAINANIACEACGDNDVLINYSRKAIDFMGASGNQIYSSNNAEDNLDSSPYLDLSLKTSQPNGFGIQVAEERRSLRHSIASAFMPYTNKALQPLHPPLSILYNQRELGAHSERRLSNTSDGDSDAPCPTSITQRSFVSLATGQTKETDIATSCPQQVLHSIQIPSHGLGFNNQSTEHCSPLPPTFCKQSSSSPMPNPSSASHLDPNFKVSRFHQSKFGSNFENLYEQLGQNRNDPTSRNLVKDQKLDSFKDHGHTSTTDSVSHLNSIGYESVCGINRDGDPASLVRTATESKNEIDAFIHDGSFLRSIQREAALTKFRLKRKERCYEKKVRYESRKKLAEQRPRVKGQFVRQAQNSPPPIEIG